MYDSPRYPHPGRGLFIAAMILLSVSCPIGVQADTRKNTVRVGIYTNPPVVTVDADHQASGFAIDILNEIAKTESWHLHYVHGDWKQILALLKKGELDLVVGIPYIKSMEQDFYFGHETLVSNWGVIHRNPAVRINSVFDLKNKRIAMVKSSVYTAALSKLLDKFDIPFTPLYAPDYAKVLEAVDSGRADAGITNRLFSLTQAARYDVIATTIIFNPVEVRYASPKKIGTGYLYKIDYNLILEKADPNSFYYAAVKRWLSTPSKTRFSSWFIWAFFLILAAALITIVINWLLRKEVRKSARELAQSEMMLQSIMDYSPALISTIDLEDKITILNRQYEKLAGAQRKNLIGKKLQALFPERVAGEMLNRHRQVINDKTPLMHEESVPHPDGTSHQYLTVRFPLLDDNGAAYSSCAISLDITEKNQAQERLRRYQQIVKASRDFMAFIDQHYCYEAINDSYLRALDKSSAEVVGTSMARVHGETIFSRQIKPDLDRCLRGKSIRRQAWMSFPDGCRRFLDINYLPYLSRDNRPAGVVLDIYDLTYMKKVEDELQTHQNQLEELVRKRTLALETANTELEAYSYSIAHDLRAPLRSITSFSQLLFDDMKDRLTEDNAHHLQRVIEAAKYMAELIDDILALAKISRSEFHTADIDMSDISTKIIKNLEESEPGRKVKYEVKNDLKVKGDPQLISIALDNLIRNAWKYTRKTRNPKIIINTKSLGNNTIYYIKDNGAGFDMRYANKLFKPFQRLHSKEDFEGTGIGLATVHRVIQRHGGKIWCEASEGKGATFFFTLP